VTPVDLSKLAAEAAMGMENPLSARVRINTPNGAQEVNIVLGLFIMLDTIAGTLQGIAGKIEELEARQIAT
jgi:hypothetical protein